MTSGVRCGVWGTEYNCPYGKLESIIDSNVCRAGELCGVERKGEVRGGGGPGPAIHISPYLPITSSVRIHDTEAAADLSQSVQFPNANVSFQIPFKEGNYKCNLSLPVFVVQYQIFLFFYQVLYSPLWKLFCFVFQVWNQLNNNVPISALPQNQIILF